jgi:predicted transcriptional regulator
MHEADPWSHEFDMQASRHAQLRSLQHLLRCERQSVIQWRCQLANVLPRRRKVVRDFFRSKPPNNILPQASVYPIQHLFLCISRNVKHHRAGHTTEPATFVLTLQVCLTQLHFHRYQIMT